MQTEVAQLLGLERGKKIQKPPDLTISNIVKKHVELAEKDELYERTLQLRASSAIQLMIVT